MTAALEPSTIKALQALWVALPVRASNDGDEEDPRKRQMQILDAYCFALSEFTSDAVWNTVNALRAGKIEDASKNFCPKAPELASYVRSEQKRLDILKSPRAISYVPVAHEFKDWRVIQRVETDRLAGEGFRCLATELGHDEFVTKARRKAFPAGSVWFWALQECWGCQA